MTYTGSITIVDEEGNAVFERELDHDEIIEQLLASIPDAEDTNEEAPPPGSSA